MLVNAQSDEQQQTDVEPSVEEASISRGIVVRHQNGRIHDEKAENCDKLGRNEPKSDAEENLCGYDRVLSIEHEDSVMTIDEGLRKAIDFLNKVIITEEKPTTMSWA